MDQPATSTECVSDATIAPQAQEQRPITTEKLPSAKLPSAKLTSSEFSGQPQRAADAMSQVYRPIQRELAAVDARLHLELQSRYEALRPVLQHGTQLGGKRLRPALTLLSGLASRPDRSELTEDHVVMGTVVEMVHTATLIHDDVLDKADTRRHVPTVNARWNDDTSILLGDYLFAQSFSLAATLPSTDACRWVGQAARAVCEGELRQVLGRDWLDIDEDVYLDVIRGKTGELTRVSCQLGAMLSGADEATVEAFGRYGNDLGIAFQIADDVLDLWGDDLEVGKTLGTDLEQGKITLPLIRLLCNADPSVASQALDALRAEPHERLTRILPLLQRSDAAEYTREVANRFRRSAIDAISSLQPTPAQRSLMTIADFSVDRKF